MSFPKHVFMVGDVAFYYRHAGDWTVSAMRIDGKLVTRKPKEHPRLGNRELVECTRDEWERDNDGYLRHHKGGHLPE